MKEYISLDCHKHYSKAERESVAGSRVVKARIEHAPGQLQSFLRSCPPGNPVAVEATSNWYWIVDAIEESGREVLLVNPHEAKKRRGKTDKTDDIDVHELNILQRCGALPTIWIPPRKIRDQRELTRTRLVIRHYGTLLKNRLHAVFGKYALFCPETDMFGKSGRAWIEETLHRLPRETLLVTLLQLQELDLIDQHCAQLEKRLEEILQITPTLRRLDTLPHVATILAAAIAFEMGDVHRFRSDECFCSYSGTTPRVISSGGKTHYGRVRQDVNTYLKYAFFEAANGVALGAAVNPRPYANRLYLSLKERRGSQKAKGAVARHLAQAAYFMELHQENYRDPAIR